MSMLNTQPNMQNMFNGFNPNLNNTIIRVNGLDSAKQFQTMPNSMYALFDENEDLVYVKTTDSSNFASIRTFQLSEVIDEPETSKYVTIEDFNRFKEELLNAQQFVQKPKQQPNVRKPAKHSKWNEHATDSEQSVLQPGNGNSERKQFLQRGIHESGKAERSQSVIDPFDA